MDFLSPRRVVLTHRPDRAGLTGRIDWWFAAATVGLLLIGTASVLSAANPLPFYSRVLERHFLALAMGVCFFLITRRLTYQVYQDQSRPLYIAVLALLAAVVLFGVTQRGHRAWFHFAFLTFQPSEFARLGLILVLADVLDRRSRRIREFSTVLWALAVAAPVVALIMKEPDLTTALTFAPILFAMLFGAGCGVGQLLGVFGFGAVALAVPLISIFSQVRLQGAAPGGALGFLLSGLHPGTGLLLLIALIAVLVFLAWQAAVHLRLHPHPLPFVAAALVLSAGLVSGVVLNRGLRGYQRNRFVAYLAPESDIQGVAYHVRQSQIAIGSGGFWGKGMFSGTQSQLGFLPERHTDFIYSTVGEELGFWGTGSILALYLILIWRILAAARLARDRYGALVCCGIASLLAGCLVLNVGMCVGLAPVAGMPLPLISYGGSSLIITLAGLGIVANIYARRFSLL